MMKRLNERFLRVYVKVSQRVKKGISNERGFNPIVGLIIAAIVVMAVLSLDTPVKTFASGMWNKFANFMDGKTDNLYK